MWLILFASKPFLTFYENNIKKAIYGLWECNVHQPYFSILITKMLMNIPIYYDFCTRVFHIHVGFSETHFQWCIVSNKVELSTRDDPRQNVNDLEKAEM